MTLVKGELRLVTDTPVGSISEVWVRARETRGQGNDLVVSVNDRVPVTNGEVEFTALPGAAVLVLVQNGMPLETLPMLIADEAEQSLRVAVQAAQVAGAADQRVIEQLSIEVAAHAARAEQYRTEAAASADAAQSSESAAATSESNAKSSETNAKQSEDNAGDYAAVATTAATEAVDAMERATDLAGGDFATHEYVDEVRWKKSFVRSTDTLDSLAEGTHEVRSTSVSSGLGIPYGVIGTLEIIDIGGARNALYVTNHVSRPRVYTNARVSGTWSGWKMQANTDDLDPLATKEYVDDSIAERSDIDAALETKADKSYVDEGRWKKSSVKSTDTLDSLEEGAYHVLNGSTSASLGIPYGVLGSLTIHDVGNARTASYITNHATNPREYINSRVSGTWSGWSRHASARDLESKADISSLDSLATKEYVDDSIAGIIPSTPPAPAINMALLGAPATPWELAGIVTNYDQGELYLDQLETQFAFVKKVTVGQTYQGRDINALVIGDDTKPVVMIECGIHGNEVAPREAIYIWARKAAQYRTWMDDICLVIIPTVNGDRTGHNRENAQSKDINRDFGNFETSEAQAVRDAFDTYNPIFYLCCHEFEHNDGNDIETSSPSNYAWFTNQYVIDVSDRVVDKIWTAVQDKGAKVDHYYTTNAPEPEGPVNTAMSWLRRVKEIPSVLIETAGGLYPKTYSQNVGVHPARYNPPLGWRVDLYHAALDASLDEISHMIQEQVIQ